MLGSPLYMAPEIVQEKEYNHKVDIWSVGVICYILICGVAPFNARNKDEIYKSILTKTDLYDLPIWSKVSNDCLLFVKRCLERDPKKRAEAHELLEHSWMKTKVIYKEVEDDVKLDVNNNLN